MIRSKLGTETVQQRSCARRGREQAASQRAPARGPGKPIPPRTIIRHSALEFLLTFVLLFGVVTFVRWVIGPSAISRAIPQIQLQLLIVGTAVGLLVAGLILSPPGRVSGGHMNPAISLAMWRFGAFPAAGVLPALAAAARRAIHPARQVTTHRLCGPTAEPHGQAQPVHRPYGTSAASGGDLDSDGPDTRPRRRSRPCRRRQ
jgi:glycerol uptake facilitator-like aquaporin